MLDAPYGVLTAPRARRLPQSTMVAFLAEDDPMKLSLNTSTPDDDYRFARHVGRKYGGTDFRYVDKLGESRVGVVLHPVRVNVIDLRPPPGF